MRNCRPQEKTWQIRYFRDFVRTSEVRLFGVVGATEIDGAEPKPHYVSFRFDQIMELCCEVVGCGSV